MASARFGFDLTYNSFDIDTVPDRELAVREKKLNIKKIIITNIMMLSTSSTYDSDFSLEVSLA